MNGETDNVPNFQISFWLNVKATVPSPFELAVGVCIKPTWPNELYELYEFVYLLLYSETTGSAKIIKKKTS